MFYLTEEKQKIRAIMRKYNIYFTDALVYLDDETKEIFLQRIRDDLLF